MATTLMLRGVSPRRSGNYHHERTNCLVNAKRNTRYGSALPNRVLNTIPDSPVRNSTKARCAGVSIINSEDGHNKIASAAAGKMIRRRIREHGFTRLILPFKPISDSDLTSLPNTELPVVVEEMEPDVPGAKSISFNDSADTEFYRADKFVVLSKNFA